MKEQSNTTTSDQGIIQIRNLKKSFGDKAVLNDINLTLKKGENLVTIARRLRLSEYMILERNSNIKWYDDVKDDGGWICVINSYDHVLKEMEKYRLYYYMKMGQQYNEMTWRAQKPDFIVQAIEELMHQKQKSIL